MRRTLRRGGADGGFALLIVLWAVVLLTLLATQLTLAGRVEVQLASNIRGAAMAEAAADGGVQAAIFHLLDPATRWAADGAVHDMRVPDAALTVTIENEGGKLNPNLATPALMRALLAQLGVDANTAESLADAIADWRFPGEQPLPHGAKAAQYRAAGLDYGPAGAPFHNVGELEAVLGMTPAVLARLAPYVTVATDIDADPALAPPLVLRAIRTVLGPARGPELAPPPRTVTITVRAAGDLGGRFTRRATVRLGQTAKEPLFQILTWEPG